MFEITTLAIPVQCNTMQHRMHMFQITRFSVVMQYDSLTFQVSDPLIQVKH